MGTPLADRIRAKAQQTANKPMTPTGASAAMAKQAAVSSTGKAATGAAPVQSSVAETVVAEQAEAQQAGIGSNIQEAGEQMAVTETAADVKQQGVESNLSMRKLEADNQFNNTLKELTSRVEMADTKQKQELLSLEMKGELARQRLNNKEYTDALQNMNKNTRLESKEDFAIAISKQGMDRAIIEGDEGRKTKAMVEDYSRDNNTQVTMAEIDAALDKSVADSKAQANAAVTSAAIEAAKMGAEYGVSEYAAGEADEAAYRKDQKTELKGAQGPARQGN